MNTIDPRQLRDACGLFGTGVNVISTHHSDGEHGMTANAFMSISLDPPLISVSIGERAKILPLLHRSGRFAVSTLAEGMEGLAWHFAGRPDPALRNPFADLGGLPVIRGALAAYACDVVNAVEAGDHTIFIGAVRALETDPGARPLIFYKGRFGAIAGQAPAPELCDPVAEAIW
ncbi:flavin reductase family protein [Pukyongiella litopenaei]|uniref:Flavin reductase family protein n=1 Tax=Pukyongiella litopenaei TaxID=2605946 RepID=A0A2S0MNN5_9RHOB|nr:flavin reductase family protein [Pukyongiella litopenaei]AVO37490.1 flavin reductase family protein [Pukyongiella litopenaei]